MLSVNLNNTIINGLIKTRLDAIHSASIETNVGNNSDGVQRICISNDDTNLNPINTNLSNLNDTIGTDGSAIPSKSIQIAGYNSGNLQTLAVDSDGRLFIDLENINGSTVATNSGSLSNGVQRVCIADNDVNMKNISNNTTKTELQLGNITEEKAIQIIGGAYLGTSTEQTLADGLNPGEYFKHFDRDITNWAIASNNSNDSHPSGSGARSVQITGYNDAGNEVSEIINLNGTTNVSLVNDYRSFTDIRVTVWGSNLANQGTLYIGRSNAIWTSGKPSQIGYVVPHSKNISRCASFQVPQGKKLLLKNGHITAGEGNNVIKAIFRLYTPDMIAGNPPYTGLVLFGLTVIKNVPFDISSVQPINAGEIIEITVSSPSSSPPVFLAVNCVLIDAE